MKIEVTYNNKNRDSILDHGKQTVFRLQHYHSFTPTKSKIGTIIGMIHLIEHSCNSDYMFKISLLAFIQELYTLFFPKQIIKKAFYKASCIPFHVFGQIIETLR